MVMAVPAHDQRDFEFAKKYELKIIPVIEKKESIKPTVLMIHGSSGEDTSHKKDYVVPHIQYRSHQCVSIR